MPASKRRKAYVRAVDRHRTGTAAPAEPAAPVAEEATPNAAAPSAGRFAALTRFARPGSGAPPALRDDPQPPARSVRTGPATGRSRTAAADRRAAKARPAGGQKGAPAAVTPDDEPMWGRVGLLALLALVTVLQMAIGLVLHFVSGRHRPILIDVFYFNTLLVLPGCVVLMPAARRLTHQPRNLRFLESLSLGALFAIFALLLTSVFLPVGHGQTDVNQILDSLTTGNVPGLALGDVLAVLAAAQVYPGLSRLLSAPGRRARKRILARGNQPPAAPGPARGKRR